MNARRSPAWLGLLIPVVVLAAGCDSSRPTPAPNRSTPTASPLVAASATATPAPVGATVVATVAAPTPTGTVVFVVVANDSTPRAPVIVTASAASSNGKATITGQALIWTLAAGGTAAAMVKLSVPADDNIGAVTATVAGTATTSPAINPLSVAGASFVSDPIQPAVNVTVSASVPRAAVVLAVCYQGHTVIGGGVAQVTTVRPGRPTTLSLAAALAQTPTSCIGYAYPE